MSLRSAATVLGVLNVPAEETFWRVNVLGTRRLLEAAAAADVGRFVHLSSVAAYGFDFPDGVDESWPVRPNGNHYVGTKVASEQVVLQVHPAGEIACSIVRPADVYGPGSRPWTLLPLELIRAGQLLLSANGRGIFQPRLRGQPDRWARGGRRLRGRTCASCAEASGQVFSLGDGVGVATHEFFGHYARMLGRARSSRCPRRSPPPSLGWSGPRLPRSGARPR